MRAPRDTAIALLLNSRMVELYGEFRDVGMSMDIYMHALAAHASALCSYQDHPRVQALAFCDAVLEGVGMGVEELQRMRSAKAKAKGTTPS